MGSDHEEHLTDPAPHCNSKNMIGLEIHEYLRVIRFYGGLKPKLFDCFFRLSKTCRRGMSNHVEMHISPDVKTYRQYVESHLKDLDGEL